MTDEKKPLWKRVGGAVLRFYSTDSLTRVFVTTCVVYMLWQAGGCVRSAMKSTAVDGEVKQVQQSIGEHGQKADGHGQKADESSGARNGEDERRDREIKPELERTARAAAESQQRVERARKNYEASKRNRTLSPLSDLELQRSNCAELAEFYPGERFEGCQ